MRLMAKSQPTISRRSKYNAKPTYVDGIRFDSKREARRYKELTLLLRIGEIRDLELQPKYDLMCNGQKIGFYKADFRYVDQAGKTVVEDVKSGPTATPVYRLKKRILATQTPPVLITEVY